MKAMFSYPQCHSIPLSNPRGIWQGLKRETVSIDAAYNNERIILHIDLPTIENLPSKQ